jgi:hypothetical protein
LQFPVSMPFLGNCLFAPTFAGHGRKSHHGLWFRASALT